MYRAVPLAILLLLTGCGQSEQAGQGAIPFKPTGDVMHLMQWVMEPAADRLWDSSGWIITEEGTQDLTPTDDETWLAMQYSATVVAESGNLLLMPGLAKDEGAWRDISLGLVDAGLKAKAAAEAQDADAFFEAGGLIYRVCRSCHLIYDRDEDYDPPP